MISCRLWEQTRSYLGADSFAAGSRRGRIWEQTRSYLGADAVEYRPVFDNKS